MSILQEIVKKLRIAVREIIVKDPIQFNLSKDSSLFLVSPVEIILWCSSKAPDCDGNVSESWEPRLSLRPKFMFISQPTGLLTSSETIEGYDCWGDTATWSSSRPSRFRGEGSYIIGRPASSTPPIAVPIQLLRDFHSSGSSPSSGSFPCSWNHHCRGNSSRPITGSVICSRSCKSIRRPRMLFFSDAFEGVEGETKPR